jgi:hypothetical protein
MRPRSRLSSSNHSPKPRPRRVHHASKRSVTPLGASSRRVRATCPNRAISRENARSLVKRVGRWASCHAGGRGFESRRSRFGRPCTRDLLALFPLLAGPLSEQGVARLGSAPAQFRRCGCHALGSSSGAIAAARRSRRTAIDGPRGGPAARRGAQDGARLSVGSRAARRPPTSRARQRASEADLLAGRMPLHRSRCARRH